MCRKAWGFESPGEHYGTLLTLQSVDAFLMALTHEQEREILLRSLDTRGRAIKIAFLFCGLLLAALLVMLRILIGLNTNLNSNSDERQGFQAEERFIDCFLARDDLEMALPDDPARLQMEELCKGYKTLEDALESEEKRSE